MWELSLVFDFISNYNKRNIIALITFSLYLIFSSKQKISNLSKTIFIL